jgi:hypothetical protein
MRWAPGGSAAIGRATHSQALIGHKHQMPRCRIVAAFR